MKISQTLSSYGGNFSRPTKFNVKINPPGSTSGPIIDVLCKSVSLPDITNAPVELTYKGHKVNIPGRTNQAQVVTLTFYIDENFNIYNIFKRWLNITDKYYYVHPGYDDTMSKFGSMSLEVVNYSETSKVKIFDFENIFPTNLSAIEYSSIDKDAISEFSVTFSYYRQVERN